MADLLDMPKHIDDPPLLLLYELRRQTAAPRQAPPMFPPTPVVPAARSTEPVTPATPPVVPSVPPRSERPLGQLFTPPAPPMVPTTVATRNPARPLEIRVVTASPKEGRGRPPPSPRTPSSSRPAPS